MLAKKYRLPIQEVVGKHCKTYKNLFFSVKIFLNNISHSRFGIIISKKVFASAVKRNKIKRIFFNAVKESKINLCSNCRQPADNKDFLMIINPKIKELTAKEIKEKIMLELEKLKGVIQINK